jgi:hypothetical protein
MSVYITLVRGQLKHADTLEENQAAHDAINVPLQALGKAHSAIGHRVYLNANDPKEFLGLDTWTTIEGPQQLFSHPKLAEEFGKLFEGMPEITFWKASGWESFADV